MIFYRLALQRIIEYLHLNELFKENEYRLMLLHRQRKKVYKKELHMDRTLNLCVSILLSIIGILVCITIPYAILQSPFEELTEYKLVYRMAKWFEKYLALVDRLIIVLCVLLVCITVKLLYHGIKSTNISMSPWLERGKYELPERRSRRLNAKGDAISSNNINSLAREMMFKEISVRHLGPNHR